MNDYVLEEIESTAAALRALGNEKRLLILHWLANPKAHFPPQVDGDLERDGVCVGFLTEKIGLQQPTVTNHMKILQEAGLVQSKRIKNWVFYKRNDAALEASTENLRRVLGAKA
jgi:ArsR family transcriptional regulator